MDVAEMSAERLFFGSGPRVHDKVATRATMINGRIVDQANETIPPREDET
jgi:hypothetical protein